LPLFLTSAPNSNSQWCGIYRSHVAFYAPLSRKPAWVLYFKDVLSVRLVDSNSSPLPGLFLFAIDTPGRVHYMAFNDEGKREVFAVKMKEAVFRCVGVKGGGEMDGSMMIYNGVRSLVMLRWAH